MESLFEKLFYSARWILAPLFLGLSLALLALALKFFQEVWHVLPHVFELSESDLILSLLSMVDMGLVGGLIMMVMYSSYENFVSRLDLDEKDSERLGWLGRWTRAASRTRCPYVSWNLFPFLLKMVPKVELIPRNISERVGLQRARMKRRGLAAIHCAKARRSVWRMKSAGGEGSTAFR